MNGRDQSRQDRLAEAHQQLGDQLLGWAVAAIGSASALTWTTGQVAGLLFGQTWIELSPAELAHVIASLPQHPGDPALAWPAATHAALPGPVGMYASLTLSGAMASGVAAAAVRAKDALTHGRRAPEATGHGAVWAKGRELRGLLVRGAEPGRVVLGRWDKLGRLLAAEDCHSVLVFGPPGSFKTAGVVIPAILEWVGPLVATSIKPDVLRATKTHRAGRGEVLVLDPLGLSGERAAKWTPLAACRSYAGAQAMASAIAGTDRAGTFDHNHRYWVGLASKLLAPVLFAAANTDRTMVDVARWIDRREDEQVEKILAELGDELAVNAWEATQSRAEKALDSVYSTTEDLISVYADARVAASTDGHDLDLGSFLTGDNTLYLYAPAHEQERLRPLFETVAAQVIREAQEEAARRPDGALDPRLLLALDEAGNVAALNDLPQLATTGRGQGIQLLTVWHDKAQLEHRYGPRANTVLNGHRAKLFLSGLADVGALELGSKLIGEQSLRERNRSRDADGRVSTSESTTYRPLVPVEAMRQLSPREAIVVYGHRKPAKLHLRPWFEPAEQRRQQRAERARDRAAARWQTRQDRAARRLADRIARRQPVTPAARAAARSGREAAGDER